MRLPHRVTFHRHSQVEDGYGNVTGEFTPLLTVWGNLRETTGKERIASGAVENIRTATLRVRSSSETKAVTEADRAVARGETWNILGIAHADDKGVMLDMLLQAGATG